MRKQYYSDTYPIPAVIFIGVQDREVGVAVWDYVLCVPQSHLIPALYLLLCRIVK